MPQPVPRPIPPSTTHPGQDAWRECVRLQEECERLQIETARLRALLTEYGRVCRLVGDELLRLGGDVPPDHPRPERAL